MLCIAKTAKGKQCSFKSSLGEYCKKHCNKQNKYERKIEFSKLMYHNHAPNIYSPDCACCKLIT